MNKDRFFHKYNTDPVFNKIVKNIIQSYKSGYITTNDVRDIADYIDDNKDLIEHLSEGK